MDRLAGPGPQKVSSGKSRRRGYPPETRARDATRSRMPGTGAISAPKMEDARYQLMITDIAMPWMNGLQVAHSVRASGPRLMIILITARANADAEGEVC